MVQETTLEFAERLTRAVEGHPLAPPTPYGRQTWLKDKLEKEEGLVLSPNTVSRWFIGGVRPRTDTIRAIAKVLKVDEVWLSLGRKPDVQKSKYGVEATADGAILLLAGLIETAGGKVSFAKPEEAPTHLYANIDTARFEASVVTPTQSGGVVNFLISEPVGSARVIAVLVDPDCKSATISVNLYDITDLPRQELGGFSVVTLEKKKNNRLGVPGEDTVVEPLKGLSEMATA